MKFGMIRNAADRAAFEYVQGKGLEFIEVCMNYTKNAEEFIARSDEIRALVDEFNIPVLSVGRWNGDGGPIDENGKMKEDLWEETKRSMDAIAKVGCPLYVCGCNYVENLSLYKNYTIAIDYFGKVMEYAKTRGLEVAVYNCHWNNFVDQSKAWEVVMGELPELGIKFDASHSVAGHRDYLQEMVDWGTRFKHVHVKGYVQINGKYVDAPPAGLDHLDWPTIMANLYAAGYDRGLSIEPHSSVWQGDLGERGVNYTVKYIRSLIV